MGRKSSKAGIQMQPKINEEYYNDQNTDVKTNNFFRDSLSPNNVNYPISNPRKR
jgi:hypothetical protein